MYYVRNLTHCNYSTDAQQTLASTHVRAMVSHGSCLYNVTIGHTSRIVICRVRVSAKTSLVKLVGIVVLGVKDAIIAILSLSALSYRESSKRLYEYDSTRPKAVSPAA